MVWLITDEQGTIMAIVASPMMANIIALALGARVEQARNDVYRLGDVLPIFHS